MSKCGNLCYFDLLIGTSCLMAPAGRHAGFFDSFNSKRTQRSANVGNARVAARIGLSSRSKRPGARQADFGIDGKPCLRHRRSIDLIAPKAEWMKVDQFRDLG